LQRSLAIGMFRFPVSPDSLDVTRDDTLLAYVFWHWRQPSAAAAAYESAQRAFQEALAASPGTGLVRSFSHALAGAPWANNGGEAYEDWYVVRDSAALDVLEQAAISAGRKAPHDVAASLAAAGTAGLYALRAGTLRGAPRFAHWFSKPAGMSYPQLFAAIAPALAPVGGSLWMRKMTLGPATEFCVLAREPATLAPPFQMFAFPLRPVWSGEDAAAGRR
jgi:hypothetical protein